MHEFFARYLLLVAFCHLLRATVPPAGGPAGSWNTRPPNRGAPREQSRTADQAAVAGRAEEPTGEKDELDAWLSGWTRLSAPCAL